MFIGIIQGGARCGDNELPGVFVSLTDEVVLEFVLEKSGLKKGEFLIVYFLDIWLIGEMFKLTAYALSLTTIIILYSSAGTWQIVVVAKVN